jgi:hypothetical protein
VDRGLRGRYAEQHSHAQPGSKYSFHICTSIQSKGANSRQSTKTKDGIDLKPVIKK